MNQYESQRKSIRITAVLISDQLNQLFEFNAAEGIGMYNQILDYLDDKCHASHTKGQIRAEIADNRQNYDMGVINYVDYFDKDIKLKAKL